MASDSLATSAFCARLEQLLHELDQQDADADGKAHIEWRKQPAAGENGLLQHALDRLAAALEHGVRSWE
jgi:hypothetical protein